MYFSFYIICKHLRALLCVYIFALFFCYAYLFHNISFFLEFTCFLAMLFAWLYLAIGLTCLAYCFALLLTSLVAFVSGFSFVLRSINFWESMRYLGFSAFYNGLASYTVSGIVIDTWLDVLYALLVLLLISFT